MAGRMLPRPDTPVEANQLGLWYDATVLKARPAPVGAYSDGPSWEAFVHYIGWGKREDGWVHGSRVRPRMVETKGRQIIAFQNLVIAEQLVPGYKVEVRDNRRWLPAVIVRASHTAGFYVVRYEKPSKVLEQEVHMQYMIKRWNFQPAPESEPVKKRERKKQKQAEQGGDTAGQQGEQTEVWLTKGHPWLGRKVLRQFGEESFVGTIIQWLPENGAKDPPLWKLQHTDGDVEDLEESEVEEGAQAWQQQSETERRTERKTERKGQAQAHVARESCASWHRIAETYQGDGCAGCGADNDDEHMLVCETCESEWHLYCLKPALKAIPEEDWFCPTCTVSLKHIDQIPDEVTKRMYSVWDDVRNSAAGASKSKSKSKAQRGNRETERRLRSDAFMKLPAAEDYPDYYEMIKTPMSLGLVRQRLGSGYYMGDWGKFRDEMLMIFVNARAYNAAESLIVKDANALAKLVTGVQCSVPLQSDREAERGDIAGGSADEGGKKQRETKRTRESGEESVPKKRKMREAAAATDPGENRSTATEDRESGKGTEAQSFCVCQAAADESAPWISCETCFKWYHPQCVGLTESEAAEVAARTIHMYMCKICMEDLFVYMLHLRRAHGAGGRLGVRLLPSEGRRRQRRGHHPHWVRSDIPYRPRAIDM